MRILLLGGTGFIGRHLITHFRKQGHQVRILSRSARPDLEGSNTSVLVGNPLQSGAWQEEAAECQAVINLVGRGIMDRWTRIVKKEILESRIQATQLVVQAIEQAKDKPVLVNANATGYYPFSESEVFDEQSSPGDHFLAQVCLAWQKEAMRAQTHGSRVVVTRFAPVLAAGGGMLEQIIPIFKKGLGGRIGSGQQPFPWIHIQDLVRAVNLAVTDATIHGPVNVCAPEVITNARFTQALAHALKRPAILPVPEFALRLRFGDLAETLTKGQAVCPTVLQDQGFPFEHTDIDQTLKDIVQTW
jgi:hypothetical protein